MKNKSNTLGNNKVLGNLKAQHSRAVGDLYRNAINQINLSGIREYDMQYKGRMWNAVKVKGFTYMPAVDEDESDGSLEFKMIFIGHTYEELTLAEFIHRFEDEEVRA